MNFIGHATVALWARIEPRFVLGSMLPDFASMAGARLGELEDHELRAGVALHHRTDDAFHGHPIFLALMQQTIDALVSRGVARGPARAVGHIGVEMLIDGELVHEAETGAAYMSALRAGADLEPNLFRGDEGATRWSLVHRRLLEHGVPYDYRNTDAVVLRLRRVLSGRPRLALDVSSEQIARSVLPEVQHAVVRRVPELLTSLRRELENGAVLAG